MPSTAESPWVVPGIRRGDVTAALFDVAIACELRNQCIVFVPAMDLTGKVLTIWSARAAAALYVCWLVVNLLGKGMAARTVSTLAFSAYLLHVWCAFITYINGATPSLIATQPARLQSCSESSGATDYNRNYCSQPSGWRTARGHG